MNDYLYPDWVADCASSGAVATTWPFTSGMYSQFYGKPAAKYPAQIYVAAVNSGDEASSVDSPTQSSADNLFVYVLAPQSAWAGAPHTMTLAEKLQNTLFTGGDKAASAVGLPSLADLESFIKNAGWLLVAALAIGLLIYAAKAKGAARTLLHK